MRKDQLQQRVHRLMLQNRRFCGEYQYTVPSPQTYPYQWLWDSCFHAIILSHLNIEDAKKELLSLVSHQYKNGFIPHMIYWDKGSSTDFPRVEWGKEDTSTITQPPMVAYAVWRIYQKDTDRDFLARIYPHLKGFYKYLLEERMGEDNLFGIINPDESGEDNSPRFDKPLGLPEKHSLDTNFGRRLELVGKNKACNFETKTCMSNFFWVKDVPFNVIAVENLLKMSEIAAVLGNKKDRKYFLEQRDLLIKGMKKCMFKDGIFWSVYGLSHQKVRVKTWAIFAPLFAKIYTQKEAQNLVDRYLLNKKLFALKFLLPTVAKDEPSYDPTEPLREEIDVEKPTHLSWRGPIWMAVNWFVYKGLKNYGLESSAQDILNSSLELLKMGGFREYYNPDTGQGMGAKDFTWGGLVLDMIDIVDREDSQR